MMKSKGIQLLLAALTGAGAMLATPAHAVHYAVRANATVETMPDGAAVTMWGYKATVPNPTAVQITALANPAATTGFTSPGPALVVPPGDSTLEITLINTLPNGHLTSLVVHGLVNGSDPVFATAADASGTACTPGTGSLVDQRSCRLRSLTQETPNGGSVTYRFTNVPPGTYLYQSGTHQQLQVQMGLFGMMTKDAQGFGDAQRHAYGSPGALTSPFDAEQRLVFSEVDARFHQAVAAGTFTGSIIDYQPTHFRLHRYLPTHLPQLLQHTTASNQTVAIPSSERQLIRMVNAGLTTRSPGVSTGHLHFVAEDGKPYPYPRTQAVALLAAAKSMDAMLDLGPMQTALTGTETYINLFDRRAGLVTTADGRLNGDFLRLTVSERSLFPTLDLSGLSPNATQGVTYSAMAQAINGGAATTRSFALVQGPAGLTVTAAGAVTWTPTNAQAQNKLTPTIVHPVTIQVTSNGRTDVGTTYIAVANVNDAPTAAADTFSSFGSGTLAAGANVKANDVDIDGDMLGDITLATGPVFFGTARCGTGCTAGNVATFDSFSLAPNGDVSFSVRNQPWFQAITAAQSVRFTYQVPDDGTPVANSIGTVTLNVQPHKAPVANPDSATYTRNGALTASSPWIEIDVLANDTAEATWSLVPTKLLKTGATGTGGGTFSVVILGTNGTPCTAATVLQPGQTCGLRYRPALSNTAGTLETIRYTIKDDNTPARTSNIGQVTITLEP